MSASSSDPQVLFAEVEQLIELLGEWSRKTEPFTRPPSVATLAEWGMALAEFAAAVSELRDHNQAALARCLVESTALDRALRESRKCASEWWHYLTSVPTAPLDPAELEKWVLAVGNFREGLNANITDLRTALKAAHDMAHDTKPGLDTARG